MTTADDVLSAKLNPGLGSQSENDLKGRQAAEGVIRVLGLANCLAK